MPPDMLKKMYVLRRILNPMGTVDAIEFLLDKLKQTKTNGDFFEFDEHLSRGRRKAASDHYVIAGLVPAISFRKAEPCPGNRDARVKPGHDGFCISGFQRSMPAIVSGRRVGSVTGNEQRSP